MRFEDSTGAYSRLVGVSVHGSTSFGVKILRSSHIEVKDLVVTGAIQMGMIVDMTRNVTVDRAFVSDVQTRGLSFEDKLVDKEGCFIIGSFIESNTGSSLQDTYVRNSIAAGCPYVGFTSPSYDCGEKNNEKFHNNVAHSIRGCGAHIYPDPGSKKSDKCMEGSHFSAYKNTQ